MLLALSSPLSCSSSGSDGPDAIYQLDGAENGGIPPTPDIIESTQDTLATLTDSAVEDVMPDSLNVDVVEDILSSTDSQIPDTSPTDTADILVADTQPDIEDTATEISDGKTGEDSWVEDGSSEDISEPPPKGDCCEEGEFAGCLDNACESLICEADPYCCSFKWDSICVDKAMELCTVCLPPLGEDCCTANQVPGCDQIPCAQAVCAIDPYCCENEWDSACVECASGGTSFDGVNCATLSNECDCPPLPPTHEELAAHWSPVWYHDTDDTDYEADYITAFDFDGDFISNNNWENLHTAAADLSAVIYYAVIETNTHWFVYYMDFHPRDWADDCNPFPWVLEPCHENDMEGAMVVIRKTSEPYGTFVVLYTEAHNTLHMFQKNGGGLTSKSNPHLEDTHATFENGSHPELYVEAKGHGVCALYYDGPSHCKHPVEGNPPPFPGGDGIVYRHGEVAETPTSGMDTDVSYALVPFISTIWPRREDVCDQNCTFDIEMTYESATLGKAFNGDTYGADKANPPWAWDDPDDGNVFRGDFFFRPAETLFTHAQVPHTISFEYIHNPYLDAVK